MIIEKIACKENNYLRQEYYYDSAREAMFDLYRNIVAEGMIDEIFLPGYIGWSPKEGSGIFDPIKNIVGVKVQYYKMTSDLSIDYDDLFDRIAKLNSNRFSLLVVNYFGFVDERIKEIADLVKKYGGLLIEDNAHGFFTYQLTDKKYSDATFFSLHKMFPFKHGGSLFVNNEELAELDYVGDRLNQTKYNPWLYDNRKIAIVRRENYLRIVKIIMERDTKKFFVPLKRLELPFMIVPQTFPIRILQGRRDKIYEQMNEAGFGVVSLYHTLIEPLRCNEYQTSFDLSECVMNLPVHQDVDTSKYGGMIQLLIELCKTT